MPNLEEILATTRATLPALVSRREALERAAEDAPPPPHATQGLRGAAIALIAEVKRRSPSAGAINPGLDPVSLAQAYAAGGARVISVLTDGPYFGGSLADLEAVADAVPVPVLRKDFILDEVQLLEARAAGAAAVLLIVRALNQMELEHLISVATKLGLTPLVETHNRDEIAKALDAGAEVVGVNSRDLDTFRIDVAAAWRLIATIPPDRIAVAESGMATLSDVKAAAEAGANAVLIGSALAAAANPEALAASLAGVSRRER